MSYISVYRIELDKDIMVLLSGREIRSDADMPYSRWYEEQLSRCKYVGMDERDCSPANLKNVITQGKIFSSGIVMKLMDVGLKWN
ncbi:MAG: hypothetical protein ACLTCQ_07895 [Enterocloster bolteae]